MKEDGDRDGDEGIGSGQPTKRVKYDPSFVPTQQQSYQPFCKCHSKSQIHRLTSAIVALQNYTKYISVLIRHQEKSLQILPKHLLETPEFAELGQRVNKCIQCARVNNQFIGKVVKNYTGLGEGFKDVQGVEDPDVTANGVVNVIGWAAKEWGQGFEVNIRPMGKIVELIKRYGKDMEEGYRVFVQGVGMGRIMCEIYEHLEKKPELIEGCEDRVLHYLFAEYFLSIYKQGQVSQVFPFMHDFTNKFSTQDIYQSQAIPTWPYPRSQPPSPQPFLLSLTTLEQSYPGPEHTNRYSLHISYLCNDRVTNILKWIQIVYKNLREGGLWVVACYASFQRNVLPITYGEFRDILGKSLFGLLWEGDRVEELVGDVGMVRERINVHYLVLKK